MGKSSTFINSEEPPKINPSPVEEIKHVYISVFFDGTNNNMVQQACFKSFKIQNEVYTKRIDEVASVNEIIDANDKIQLSISSINYLILKDNISVLPNAVYKSCVADISDAINKLKANIPDSYDKSIDEIQDITTSLKSYDIYNDKTKITSKIYQLQAISTTIIDENLERLQIESKFSVDSLYEDKENGYSNIAILHSLSKTCNDTDNAIYKTLYIEGSGANDIATTKGNILYPFEKNTNGLGFGLGNTGVTALVSKAIKYIYDFLNSIKSKLDENTEYHFYVFGFSRGATCARLFSELTTRNEGKTLPREKEFGQETSKVANIYKENNNRIPFMERTFINGLNIKRGNVKVDFLGIYDTVASIGFLKQKDGWANTLSWAYRAWWWNNYHGNFHYKNAHDYGLYSPHNPRVLKTCHICAADEFRENFALVNLGKQMPQNAIEIIIPGCHSDVGGGYVTKVDMDAVLYKFVPRKFERILKSYVFRYNPNTVLYLKNKKQASMFVDLPYSADGITETLSPKTLAKLGWIDKCWETGKYDKDNSSNETHYTLRVADWPTEIKFKRYVEGGYSVIPLHMMLKVIKNCGMEWLFDNCFKENGDKQEINTAPYAIPNDADLNSLWEGVNNLKLEDLYGKRIWLIPKEEQSEKTSYSADKYRRMRLKYLHFTSSCEIHHFRMPVKKEFTPTGLKKNDGSIVEKEDLSNILDIELANFGNNCNYDNNAKICRIMYYADPPNDEGKAADSDNAVDHKNSVHYMYDFGDNVTIVGF